MRKKLEIDMDAFAADNANGMTVSELERKYKNAKSTVYRLRSSIATGDSPEAEQEVEITEPANFDLTVTVPTVQLDDMLAKLEMDELRNALCKLGAQDKATIVQIVLQQRMDEAFAA